MHIRPYTFPRILRPVFKRALIRLPGEKAAVFLTFDDGPTPDITPRVMEMLQSYDAKATFFLIGDKLNRHPGIARELHRQGHALGNHTWNHLNASKVSRATYYANIDKTQRLLEHYGWNKQKLFRPPYGRITPGMVHRLYRNGYRTVLWTHLAWDFAPHISPLQSVEILKTKIRPGDIIVFHDSTKAWPSLSRLLPEVLQHIYRKGWKAETLENVSG